MSITKSLSSRSTRQKKRKTTKRRLAMPNTIPRIVHQIWFGKPAEPWRMHLFETNRRICLNAGWEYRLWTNDDRNRTEFSITFAYQETALTYGNTRWAQVADLARLEIIYKHGGVYLDSLFEISPALLDRIARLSASVTFVGANEDPCGLDCVGYAGNPYLTNSFFGAVAGHVIFKRLLNVDEDGLMETHVGERLHEKEVNRVTGPYFLRMGIENPKKDGVFLFETGEIYPFNVNESAYRPVHPNLCLSSYDDGNSIKVNDNPTFLRKNCTKHVHPLATYLSGLGGTWSWD